MSTALSLPSPSALHNAFNAFKSLFRNVQNGASPQAAPTDTADVWRLYRLNGGADSVSPAALAALSRHAGAR
jgi:hypothetical protein